MFTPVRFRLPFPTDREAPQVARCDNSKKSSSRKPSTFGQSFSENLSSGPLRRLEKEQLQIAFGFWSILCKKPLQPSEMCPEKTLRPDCLRLLVNPFRKISPATRCDDPKKYSSRLPSAFGQFSAKSLASVRKCTPKRRSGQTTSGRLSTPTARLPKWPVAITRKSTAPDGLRLWIYTERKAPPVFGDIPQPFASGGQL